MSTIKGRDWLIVGCTCTTVQQVPPIFDLPAIQDRLSEMRPREILDWPIARPKPDEEREHLEEHSCRTAGD
jgi:hypothetical protein